jgi:hypothetical protein
MLHQYAASVVRSAGVVVMHLEEYFDFLGPDDIRLKGTRVGIETILYDHIHRARTPEQIVASYPSLSLEQVYATILYRLRIRRLWTPTSLSGWSGGIGCDWSSWQIRLTRTGSCVCEQHATSAAGPSN